MVGVWYGKAPGVDRAGDAMRHGNMCGAHRQGRRAGARRRRPGRKSSTVPCISERALAGFGLPVMYPSDAAEIVRLGRYASRCRERPGCWVGMKITADVADGVYTVDGSEGDIEITVPELEWDGAPWRYRQTPMLLPPGSLTAEAQLYGPRAAMLRAFLAANPVNTVEVDPGDAWLGVVAGGKAFTRRAPGAARPRAGRSRPGHRPASAGVRLLRLGMIHPVQRDLLRRFADGLRTCWSSRRRPRSSRPRSAMRSTGCRRLRRCSARRTPTARRWCRSPVS